MTSIVKHQKVSADESFELKHHVEFIKEGVFYYADDIFSVRGSDDLVPVKLTPPDGGSNFEIFSTECSNCGHHVIILFRDPCGGESGYEPEKNDMDICSDGDEPYNPVGAIDITPIKRPRSE